MNEPAAIYSFFQQRLDENISSVQNTILMQAKSALIATVKKINYLENLGPRTGRRVFSNQNISHNLQDLCTHARVASQILFNDTPKQGRLESENAYNLRLERVRYVKKFCDQKIEIKVLIDGDMRNSLVHIDEKLADILTEKEGVAWFIDHAVSVREGPTELSFPDSIKEVKYCRSYIHNENKILHLDHELNLNTLKHECIGILALVFGFDGTKI